MSEVDPVSGARMVSYLLSYRPWFAWKPVRVRGRWVWLRWVRRRMDWMRSNEDLHAHPFRLAYRWEYAQPGETDE